MFKASDSSSSTSATATPPGAGGTPGGTGGTPGGTSREARLDALYQQMIELVGLPAGQDPTKKLPRSSNPYGKQTEAFVKGAVELVTDCPEVFQRNAGLADRLTNNGGKYAFLSEVVLKFSGFQRQVKFELASVTTELTDDIGSVIKTRDTIVDNPNGEPALQAQVTRSSKLLQQLRNGRSAGKAGKAQGTKAAGDKTANDGTKIATLEVQNKYLSGEELKPDDLLVQTTAARSKGKKAPVTTTTAASTVAPVTRKGRVGGARNTKR